MIPQPFQRAIPILQKLVDAGYEAYFVGGSVRDYLIDRPINDVDIATSALPEEVKKIFKKTVDVGIEHGTILVIEDGIEYEVTTFRAESDYKDFRRPETVTFIRSLVEDLQRRDFTMNAIAMDISGNQHDPFNGYADLQAHTIRTVGSATERFHEDALRMMRAVRFVSQLSFSLEKDTFQALHHYHHLLQHIAVERITAEFEKLLAGNQKKLAVEMLVTTEIYLYLPNVSSEKETLKTIGNLDINSLTVEQMWLLLIHEIKHSDAYEFLKGWKLPTKKIKQLMNDLSFLRARFQNDWDVVSIYRATPSSAINVEVVYRVLQDIKSPTSINYLHEMYEQLPIQHRSELTVTGSDLMEWTGKSGGPWVKEYLEEVEKAVLHRKVQNDKASIREWLETCNRL